MNRRQTSQGCKTPRPAATPLKRTSRQSPPSRLAGKGKAPAKGLAAVLSERDLLASIINSSIDEIWFTDTKKRFLLANPTAAHAFRLPRSKPVRVEPLARSLEVYRGDGSPRPVEEAPPLRALRGEIVQGEDEIIRTPEKNELRHRQVSSAPVRDARGRIVGSVSIVRDITQRREAEAAMRESEARYRTLFEQAADAIVLFDPETTRIVDFNDAVCRQLGYTRSEFARLRISDIDVIESRDKTRRQVRRVMRGELAVFETRHRRKDGRMMDVEIRPKPVHLNGRLLIQAIWRDITAQKRAEKSLRQAHATLEKRVKERTAELRGLAAQLVRAEEQERQRIALVLHDDLQQMITGARLMLGRMRTGRPENDPHRLTEQIDAILSQAVQSTQSLCIDLRPPILYEQGLIDALQWLAEKMGEAFGLIIRVDAHAEAEPKSNDLRVFAYEAAKELLLNVAKHAGARRAWVRLSVVHGHLQISVRDRGKGFDGHAARSGRFGLFSLRERAAFFGGRMNIQSAPEKGTRVTLLLPQA